MYKVTVGCSDNLIALFENCGFRKDIGNNVMVIEFVIFQNGCFENYLIAQKLFLRFCFQFIIICL